VAVDSAEAKAAMPHEAMAVVSAGVAADVDVDEAVDEDVAVAADVDVDADPHAKSGNP